MHLHLPTCFPYQKKEHLLQAGFESAGYWELTMEEVDKKSSLYLQLIELNDLIVTIEPKQLHLQLKQVC